MSKIMTIQKASLSQPKRRSNKATPSGGDGTSTASSATIDLDDFTCSSSILEFLSKEQECCSDAEAESIFQEVSRLADDSDTRSVDEILREAELLIQQQTLLGTGEAASKQQQTKQSITMNAKYTKRIENVRPLKATKMLNGHCQTPSPPPRPSAVTAISTALTPQTPTPGSQFAAFVDNLSSVSAISEESRPKDMENFTTTEKDDTTAHFNDEVDTDDGTDTLEEITEAMETIELIVNEETGLDANAKNFDANNTHPIESNSAANANASFSSVPTAVSGAREQSTKCDYAVGRRPSGDLALAQKQSTSPTRRTPLNFNATQVCSANAVPRRNSGGARRSSMTTPDSGISQGQSPYTPRPYSPLRSTTKTFCDKSVNSSPKHMKSSLTSPIEPFAAFTREHALKHEIEQLQEKLKDTEERLKSLRIQHESLSQLHRDLRENNTHLQEESEVLKLDVQHLNECANILRSELQSARTDRNEALELQKSLQAELEESRQERKYSQEQKDKDSKTIQDLQRQCREMERILVRKYPDSVSALIVASKNPNSKNDENGNSRKLLEQRIAQLESDAKEQDKKAQEILANVQARFNSVQAKYETHIADLETQVLSLQEINTKLNEKIESQVRTLDYFVGKKADRCFNNSTQTEPHPMLPNETNAAAAHSQNANVTITTATQTFSSSASTRDHSTNTIGCSGQQHSASSSTSSTANSTPNTSRPNSKQSGLRKPIATAALSSMLTSKLPVSQSDSTIAMTSSSYQAAASAKEDAHLVATIRGMRVDLAIKEKAIQRLTRELEECKKTIKKVQRERDALKSEKPPSTAVLASTSRRIYDASHFAEHTPANTENQALKEAQNKVKLLQADYKSLHDKRLQDLKTLQTAHERELASCHETVRILQQRLNEREEAVGVQKRRKVPVDYYALKAKVSSLERRHSEREERLHMLVEALSKGRLNGALEDLRRDNNNQ